MYEFISYSKREISAEQNKIITSKTSNDKREWKVILVTQFCFSFVFLRERLDEDVVFQNYPLII